MGAGDPGFRGPHLRHTDLLSAGSFRILLHRLCLAPDWTSKDCSVATPGQKGGETARSLELFGSGFESWPRTCLLCALVGKIMAAGLSFPSSALSQQCAPRPHRVGSEEATCSCGEGSPSRKRVLVVQEGPSLAAWNSGFCGPVGPGSTAKPGHV